MNFLFLFDDEVDGQTATVREERAAALYSSHRLRKDATVAVVTAHSRGRGIVRECEPGKIVLNLNMDEKLPPRLPLHLIVAVPRPQTIKKVLQAAAAFGVRSLSFVRSEQTVKSYLQSVSLQPAHMEAEMLMSLEQVGDGVFPEVKIFKNFYELTRFLKDSDQPARRMLLDPRGAAKDLSFLVTAPEQGSIVAIGPESGWSPQEVEQFLALGFTARNLGPRIFRVEHAVALLLGTLTAQN